MKKIALILFFVILTNIKVFAQVPEKINYQAVIRDASGELLTDQNVGIKVSILDETSTGTVLYSEEHAVSTNAYGQVAIEIGGGTFVSGNFSTIDWGLNDKFLKLEVDIAGGTSYVPIGTSQMLSVPYALYANVATTAEVLGTEGVYSTSSDTLFVVKDHSGNVVFVVFPDGAQVIVNETVKGSVGGFAVSGRSPSKAVDVDILKVTVDSTRIYVNDTVTAKGSVGGFAISGRSPSKNINNNLLFVTADSTRIYFNEEPTAKGKVGGFAISGRSPSKGITYDYLQVTKDSTRVYVTESVTKGSVGGFAVSGRSPSKGENDYFNISGNTNAQTIDPSEARIFWYPKKEAFLTGRVLVESPDSVGTNSMATGFESKSIGNCSQALGYKARAFGNNSTAIGNNSNAEGIESYALGNSAKTTGTGSYAIGSGASALGTFSFAMGSTGVDSEGNITYPTKASGNYAYAFGMGSIASDMGAFAFGTQDTASGKFCTAIGDRTKASGRNSTAMGHVTNASGIASTAMGEGTVASGDYSSAMGKQTTAGGMYSTAMGVSTTASGMYSTAMGWSTTAIGNNSIAMGVLTQAKGNTSTAMGYETIADTTYSTAMGFQTTASGYTSTAMGSGTIADTTYSTAMGYGTTASGYTSTAMGNSSVASGDYSMATGLNSIASGSTSTAIGNSTTARGSASVAMGGWTVASGAASMAMGYGSIANGHYSTAIGDNTTARAYNSFVVGRYNDTLITSSINSWSGEDPLFIIGNGDGEDFRNNAMMVKKNGEVYFPDVYGDDIGASISLYINSNGQIGTVQSARQYKKDIVPMENIDWIYQLRPVNFLYKNNKNNKKQYGLVAEDVEKVNPLFVSYNKNGEVETVSYSQLVTPMLKAIQDQENQIKYLKDENEILKQKLNEIIAMLENK